ncbi:MAG: SMP-30/gluconolactonase/LRE family protein, partial [Acidobacteria bacterium]|nr:SMP-30/gluconolactonase/LRE family protein [Acidobacteriota bacterium]
SFGFTNDLDVASDGTVYFSDASSRFGVDEYLYDLLEARPHGRLLAYDPASRKVRVLLDGLYFANGVALSRDEDFVLVNETYRYRILRYWLKGPRAGTSEVFAEALPGFPDGVSANRQGTFWVALFTVRNPLMDRLHPHPWAKSLLSKLPKAFWPKPAPYGLVLAMDEDGRILGSLQDPGGKRVREVTSVEEHEGTLYLGNLSGQGIARLPTPESPGGFNRGHDAGEARVSQLDGGASIQDHRGTDSSPSRPWSLDP